MSNKLNKNQIENLRKCGQILNRAIYETASRVMPGVSTFELDRIAEQSIISQGARPAFKGYNVGSQKYPNTLCVSIDSEVVHGLVDHKKTLKEGEIVSLDLGVEYRGVFSDMSITLPVGEISSDYQSLIDLTKQALAIGIKQAQAGNRIGCIGNAIEKFANENKLGVIKDLVGHGIGTSLHADPQIPNFGSCEYGPIIEEGMALAIEPMLTLGGIEIQTMPDNWTITTRDGSPVAHFEHTVVIVNGKPEIVTG
jgi:methionyl aminopeptidase